MALFLHFLFGFLCSFLGSITPSMLNMTALKISLEKNEKEANLYALGVSFIVIFQVYIAVILTKYLIESPKAIAVLEKLGIIVFFVLSIYFYRTFKKERVETSEKDIKKSNSFLVGIGLSALNFFAIPFFLITITSLESFQLFDFEIFSITFFILGCFFGTFYILSLYAKFAKRVQKITGELTRKINLVLSFLTGLVAVLTLIKYLIN